MLSMIEDRYEGVTQDIGLGGRELSDIEGFTRA